MLSKKMQLYTVIFYGIFCLIGFVLVLINNSITRGLSEVCFSIVITGFLSFAFNRKFKINVLFKILMIIAAIILQIVIVSIFEGNLDVDTDYSTICIINLIISFCVFMMSRICLMKSKGFFLISVIMPPVLIGIEMLCFQMYRIETFITSALCIAFPLMLLYFGGKEEQYYERSGVLVTQDGKQIYHQYGNVYKDDYGNYYELDSSGNYITKR